MVWDLPSYSLNRRFLTEPGAGLVTSKTLGVFLVCHILMCAMVTDVHMNTRIWLYTGSEIWTYILMLVQYSSTLSHLPLLTAMHPLARCQSWAQYLTHTVHVVKSPQLHGTDSIFIVLYKWWNWVQRNEATCWRSLNWRGISDHFCQTPKSVPEYWSICFWGPQKPIPLLGRKNTLQATMSKGNR